MRDDENASPDQVEEPALDALEGIEAQIERVADALDRLAVVFEKLAAKL